MLQDYMHSNIIYVQATATFDEDGFFHPITFTYDKTYAIDEIVESSVVREDEYHTLFPAPPDIPYHRIYKYAVRLGRNIRHIYFDVWPESGTLSLGRWFVHVPSR